MASAQAAAAAIRRKARRRNRNLITAGGVVGVVVVGYFAWHVTHPAVSSAGPMITAPVTRGDITETITATGSVDAQTGAQVNIGSQITGTIQHLYADVGTLVKAGQPIAVLDLPDMRAQLQQSRANLAETQAALQQQLSTIGMTHSQVSSGVAQAEAQLKSAESAYAASMATAHLQSAQVPTDITKAQAALGTAQAALNTAESQKVQTDKGAALQVANAQEAVTQAKANTVNANLALTRDQELLARGFVAQSVVDAAKAQATVYQSQTAAAKQSLALVKQQVTASLQTAKDQVAQAEQGVASAKAALASAEAEPYQVAASQANAASAAAAVKNARASLRLALGNRAQDAQKAAQVAQAEQAVQVAEQQVKYYQAQLAKTIIRSPITGTVLQLAEQQGETLAAGLSAPTLIVVCDLNRLQVDAYVDETDIGKVRLGQKAQITVDAYPKDIYTGHVSKIASGATILQGVVTYDVTIALDHQSTKLKPSMTTNVTLDVSDHHNVLLVPSEAIQLHVNGASVNVVKKVNGKTVTVPTPVQIGGSDGVNTEVKSGLTEGEIIELAGDQTTNHAFNRGNTSPFTSGKKPAAKKK